MSPLIVTVIPTRVVEIPISLSFRYLVDIYLYITVSRALLFFKRP